MPRTARISYPGGVFHVVTRFARNDWWLDKPGARDAYRTAIGQALATHDATVVAYCLMSNHVHLVVIQGQTSLERFLKSVHTGFAHWVRRHWGDTCALGPVFAGRPRMTLVSQEGHLATLIRYVHNNPVRAGVAESAAKCDWSSHQEYVGLKAPASWLGIGVGLAAFGTDASSAAARFDAFVGAGVGEARRPELSGATNASEAAAVRRALGDGHRISGGVLGDDTFVKQVRASIAHARAGLSQRETARHGSDSGRPGVREVIDATLAALRVDPLELELRPKARRSGAAKQLATWVWVHEYGGRQIDVARALGESTGSVSRHYGAAVAAAAALDETATRVTAILRQGRASGPTGQSEPLPVRYHVDVDEY